MNEIGATAEALEILKPIQDKPLPEISLYQLSALVSQWRYREAIQSLKRYLAFPDLTEYRQLIGLVNLAAAHIFERSDEEAESTLDQAQRLATRLKATRLAGNCMELRGQLLIFRGDFKGARRALQSAEESLRESGTLDSFLVRKWMAILELRRQMNRSEGLNSSLPGLQEVRREAEKRGDWESMRDCDFHRAIAKRDTDLYWHVYYGTPYRDYRQRMEREKWNDFGPEPKDYIWHLGAGRRSRARVFDLELGRETGSRVEIRGGGLPHRLLDIFCRDFYRPGRIAGLSSSLFEGEYFHPVATPDRVHKILRRLRSWFSESGVPLAIREVDGNYSLAAIATYGIRKRESASTISHEDVLLDRLAQKALPSEFSCRQAARALGISERTTVRFLSEALAHGKLSRRCSRAGARYTRIN
jgi:tetratricopeptide (TPR) repeat protein